MTPGPENASDYGPGPALPPPIKLRLLKATELEPAERPPVRRPSMGSFLYLVESH